MKKNRDDCCGRDESGFGAVRNALGRRRNIQAIGFWSMRRRTISFMHLNCGAGEIAAAAATQFLISQMEVDFIVNFGVVGGLTEEMTKTKMCVVESVVHYDFDTTEVDAVEVGRYLTYPDIYIPTTPDLVEKAENLQPDLKRVVCASGDKFIGNPEKRRKWTGYLGADICEMEAAGIVLTSNRNRVPCPLIKIVSDSVSGRRSGGVPAGTGACGADLSGYCRPDHSEALIAGMLGR